MLKIDNLHVHYGLSHVIQGISIEAKPGEVVGIFGRNGVGKTTLMKTIAGWVQPSGGSIELDGSRLDGLSPDRVCRHGVGFVPEDRRIFPGLSVEENLELGLLQRAGRSRAEKKAEVERIYERMPRLKERRRQLGWSLSGGEQQMLAIGRALMARPRLLLLDEPSLGLAPRLAEEVYERVRLIAEAGLTILVVEQNTILALAVADRAYVLETGRIVLEGPADELKQNARVREAYLGR